MKRGISLIVLVITIIVMIILVAATVMTLSDAGIINKANEAVNDTNSKEVEQLATLVWAEEFMAGKRGETLKEDVLERLKEYTDEYDIEVDDKGINVGEKYTGPTLASLITGPEDYSKTVDYVALLPQQRCEYSDEQEEFVCTDYYEPYSKWQVLYEDTKNNRVFLISTEKVIDQEIYEEISVTDLTSDEKAMYSKFQVGDDEKFDLVNEVNGTTMLNCQAIAYLTKKYSVYANTKDYGSYVEGAIGGPTIELWVASWNEKHSDSKVTTVKTSLGYMMGNNEGYASVTTDNFLLQSNYYYLIMSPSATSNDGLMAAGNSIVGGAGNLGYSPIRPVVCISGDIPAELGSGDYDFKLIKQSE